MVKVVEVMHHVVVIADLVGHSGGEQVVDGQAVEVEEVGPEAAVSVEDLAAVVLVEAGLEVSGKKICN